LPETGPADSYTGLGPRAVRPLANGDLDLSETEITPIEAFVLSRVDGHTSYRELCMVSGLPPEQTLEILRALKGRGFVVNPGENTGEPPSKGLDSSVSQGLARFTADRHQKERPSQTGGVPPSRPGHLGTKESKGVTAATASKSGVSLLERLDNGPAVDRARDHDQHRDRGQDPDLDPHMLEQGPALDIQVKIRIVRVHRRLATLDPATLLGVAADADARTIKRAYFAASKELHPDRYFGQDLGPFRPLLEALFKRCTEAFKALSKSGTRS